jgi:hypothetical protein
MQSNPIQEGPSWKPDVDPVRVTIGDPETKSKFAGIKSFVTYTVTPSVCLYVAPSAVWARPGRVVRADGVTQKLARRTRAWASSGDTSILIGCTAS